MKWLKHAFALDDGSDPAPTEPQREAIDRVLRESLKRGLDVPTGMLLETCRPLNFVTGQLVRFFSPAMKAVLGTEGQDDFARFLEQRQSIDYLLNRLDELRRERSVSPPQL